MHVVVKNTNNGEGGCERQKISKHVAQRKLYVMADKEKHLFLPGATAYAQTLCAMPHLTTYDMITLDDSLWKELRGGYRSTYDASIPLKRLEETKDKNEIEEIFEELWDELHHQGDVDLASYLAVPQLVRIARKNNIFDWNILAICATIEQQRLLGQNPALPKLYEQYYQDGLSELKKFILDNMASATDEITFRSALSALAACNRHVKLSKAIIEMSDDVLDEFLERY